MSDSEIDLVVVKHLSDPASAKLVVQILLGEKIPAFLNGTELMDEFGMSQALLGSMACDVQVPKAFEEQARKVLAAAKEAGERLDESEEWKDGDKDA